MELSNDFALVIVLYKILEQSEYFTKNHVHLNISLENLLCLHKKKTNKKKNSKLK